MAVDLLPTVVNWPKTPRAVIERIAPFYRVSLADGDVVPATLEKYLAWSRDYLRWCLTSGIHPARATTQDVMTYRAHLLAKHQPTTAEGRMVGVRKLYEGLRHLGLVQDNPAEGVKIRRKRVVGGLRRRALTINELRELLASLPAGDTLLRQRDRLFVHLAALHGLRVGELHALTLDRVTREEVQGRRVVTVLRVIGKGGHERMVPLRSDTADVLDDYLERRGSCPGPLFRATGGRGKAAAERTIHHALKLILVEAGFGDKRPHDLRHTAARLMAEGGSLLVDVQAMLGHADVKTTGGYLEGGSLVASNPAETIQI